jgi:hypothetical protein
MAEKAAQSYADAMARSRALLAGARLADPGEHFPYKHAAVSALIEENPPAGPMGEDDTRVRVRDFISPAIADATRDYVDAQAAYLARPGEDTKAAYEVARDILTEARRRHRVGRDGFAVTAFRGGE